MIFVQLVLFSYADGDVVYVSCEFRVLNIFEHFVSYMCSIVFTDKGGSVFSCRPPAGRCGPAGVGQVWLSAHTYFLAGMLIVTSSTKPVNLESSASLKTLSATGVASSTPTSAVSSAE